jgi:hypothetical protein
MLAAVLLLHALYMFHNLCRMQEQAVCNWHMTKCQPCVCWWICKPFALEALVGHASVTAWYKGNQLNLHSRISSCSACHLLQDTLPTPPAPVRPRIASSITTAHRPHLFRRSAHSFRARCLDCHKLVTNWYAVDGGSTPETLAQMQQDAPPCAVTWL